jgi:DNA-binding CsgD family transcriptional regulator
MIAGLIDSGIELLSHCGNDYAAINGMLNQIYEFPTAYKNAASAFIEENKQVENALIMLGFTCKEKQVKKFYFCNHSEADENPDVLSCGTLGEREFVRCPNRGNCNAEGILCKIPFGMSKREIQVVSQIGKGFLDKEICENLNIAQDTLRNHKDHISQKAGLSRKAEIAVLAAKLNLV